MKKERLISIRRRQEEECNTFKLVSDADLVSNRRGDFRCCSNTLREQCTGLLGARTVSSNLIRYVDAAAAVLFVPGVVKADEGGVSFWVPGFFGSLAAAPQQPRNEMANRLDCVLRELRSFVSRASGVSLMNRTSHDARSRVR